MITFDYDKTPINHEYKSTFQLDDKTVNEYLKALNSSENSEDIPSSIFAIYHLWNSTIGKPVPGTIHLKQKMEYFLKPSRGDIYDVLIKVTEKYQKKNRNYLVFETLISKKEKLYCKETTTYLWGFASAN
jgi:predicted acetyltransferase